MAGKQQPRILVVGAGVAGLSAAAELVRRGHSNLKVFEARQRVGGRVYTVRPSDGYRALNSMAECRNRLQNNSATSVADSFNELPVNNAGPIIELGAQWVHGQRDNSVFELCVSELARSDGQQDLLDLDAPSFFDTFYNWHQLDGVDNDYMAEAVRIFEQVKNECEERSNEYVAAGSDRVQVASSLHSYLEEHFYKKLLAQQPDPHRQELLGWCFDWAVRLENEVNGGETTEMSANFFGQYVECEGNGLTELGPRGYSGFIDLLLRDLPLDMIHSGTEVTHIDYSARPIRVTSTAGVEEFDFVICTLPLGVLKARQTCLFTPALEDYRSQAIAALGFGTCNKVYLEFAEKDVFWNPGDIFQILWKSENRLKSAEDPTVENKWYYSLNRVNAVRNNPCLLVAWIAGEAARRMEALPEQEVLLGCHRALQMVLGRSDLPLPQRIVRSSWSSDPFALGSYTFISTASDVAPDRGDKSWSFGSPTGATDPQQQEQHRFVLPSTLANPIVIDGAPVLCFAGEATSAHFYSTVHGAHDSGRREATRLADFLQHCSGPPISVGPPQVAAEATAMDSGNIKSQSVQQSPIDCRASPFVTANGDLAHSVPLCSDRDADSSASVALRRQPEKKSGRDDTEPPAAGTLAAVVEPTQDQRNGDNSYDGDVEGRKNIEQRNGTAETDKRCQPCDTAANNCTRTSAQTNGRAATQDSSTCTLNGSENRGKMPECVTSSDDQQQQQQQVKQQQKEQQQQQQQQQQAFEARSGDSLDHLRLTAFASANVGEQNNEIVQRARFGPGRHFRVVIIGAGAAGLGAAMYLTDRSQPAAEVLAPEDVVILEAHLKPGGRIRTYYGEDNKIGGPLELGAQWVHGEEDNILFEFCNRHNLLSDPRQDYSVEGKGLFLLPDGSSVPEELVEQNIMILDNVKSELASLGNGDGADLSDALLKYKSVFDMYRRRLEAQLENNSQANGTTQHERISDPISDLLMSAVLDWYRKFEIVDNSCNDPDQLALRGFGEYVECPGVYYVNFKSGFESFVRTAVDRLPKGLLQLGCPVSKVVWKQKNSANKVVSVELVDGSVVTCDHLIMTPSVGVLKHFTFEPPLPKYKHEVLSCFGFDAMDKIFLIWDDGPFWTKDTLGFQLLWPKYDKQFFKEHGEYLRGIYGFETVTGRPNVLLAWIGGDDAMQMEQLSDDEVLRGCYQLLKRFADKVVPSGVKMPSRIIRSSWGSDRFIKGAYSHRLLQYDHTPDPVGRLQKPLYTTASTTTDKGEPKLCPLVLFAGEATDPSHFSTVHGALRSGQREAKRLVNYWKSCGQL